MEKKAIGYARIHIYVPEYLHEMVEEHRDMLKGLLSPICQEAIEDYIRLNVIPYKELKAREDKKWKARQAKRT